MDLFKNDHFLLSDGFEWKRFENQCKNNSGHIKQNYKNKCKKDITLSTNRNTMAIMLY